MGTDNDNTKRCAEQERTDDDQTLRGVRNTRVVDLISLDPATDEIVLLMIEDRPWGSDPKQLDQLQEKLNNYLDYILDGYLTKQYPDYLGKRARIELSSVSVPEGEAASLIDAIQSYLRSVNIGFKLHDTVAQES